MAATGVYATACRAPRGGADRVAAERGSGPLGGPRCCADRINRGAMGLTGLEVTRRPRPGSGSTEPVPRTWLHCHRAITTTGRSPKGRKPMTAPNPPLPQQIYLIRHGEKPADPPASPLGAPAAASGPPFGVDIDGNQNEHSLLPRGWQRCGALAA